MIRKGQIRWLAKDDVVGQRQFIHTLFGTQRRPLRNSYLSLAAAALFATDPFFRCSATGSIFPPVSNGAQRRRSSG